MYSEEGKRFNTENLVVILSNENFLTRLHFYGG